MSLLFIYTCMQVWRYYPVAVMFLTVNSPWLVLTLEHLLKCRLLNSVGLEWGLSFWFVTNSQVTQMLLTHETLWGAKIPVLRQHDRPMKSEPQGLRPGTSNASSCGLIPWAAGAETHWPRSLSRLRGLPSAQITVLSSQHSPVCRERSYFHFLKFLVAKAESPKLWYRLSAYIY